MNLNDQTNDYIYLQEHDTDAPERDEYDDDQE
jgi:hypothetical protein